MKRFSEWMKLKERLDGARRKTPRIVEGEVWWTHIGENVGVEINGKHEFFSRPAYVLKRLSPMLSFVIPTTTILREGDWYVPLTLRGRDMTACLHQARVLDHRRFSSRLGLLPQVQRLRLVEQFRSLYSL